MCRGCYLAETKAVNPKGYGGWPPFTLPSENNSKEIQLPTMAFLTQIGDSLPTGIGQNLPPRNGDYRPTLTMVLTVGISRPINETFISERFAALNAELTTEAE